MLGYNLGSGQRPFASSPEMRWINVDCQERWHPDIVAHGEAIPAPDGTADYVVLHHVLEHYGCGEARGLIAEAWRLLAPGGSLLVFVPDMRALANGWRLWRISTQVYLTNVYGAYMGDEADRHKWGFDHDALEKFLEHCCNAQVRPFDWRPIPGADLARDWWVLAMEVRK